MYKYICRSTCKRAGACSRAFLPLGQRLEAAVSKGACICRSVSSSIHVSVSCLYCCFPSALSLSLSLSLFLSFLSPPLFCFVFPAPLFEFLILGFYASLLSLSTNKFVPIMTVSLLLLYLSLFLCPCVSLSLSVTLVLSLSFFASPFFCLAASPLQVYFCCALPLYSFSVYRSPLFDSLSTSVCLPFSVSPTRSFTASIPLSFFLCLLLYLCFPSLAFFPSRHLSFLVSPTVKLSALCRAARA